MRAYIASLALALVVLPNLAAAAASPDATAIMATVHQFTDGLNKGDVKSALAACASPASIVDEFPPYGWQGANACADWANDFAADSAKNGITDTVVTLGKPKHVDVSGDRAYVVAPATYTFKKNGKKVTESGSTMTLALQKSATGWLITGWAWTKH